MVDGGVWRWVVMGGPWRPLEATKARSRSQILAQLPISSPPPPGPLKLRLFRKSINEKNNNIFSYSPQILFIYLWGVGRRLPTFDPGGRLPVFI